MRQRIPELIATAGFFIIAASVHAGPLGLDMGTSLSKLQEQIKLQEDTSLKYLYNTDSLPNGHSDFKSYSLLVTPPHGLCKVMAFTSAIPTSVYGTELQTAFNRLAEAITTKYGTGNRYDYLNRGSIWDDQRYWMTALRKKERVLEIFWTNEKLTLPDQIKAISLEASAINTENGLITLGYEFNNASDCLKWVRDQKNSSL